MKSVIIAMCVVGVVGLVVSEPVMADPVTRYLCTSGDWDDGQGGQNWSTSSTCSGGSTGVPDIDDDVVIKSGKTVDVNVVAVCRSINVESTAVLNIEQGWDLTINTVASPGPTTSYVNGTVYLQGSNSRFRFEDADHTLTGSGEIVGQNEAAYFEIRTIHLVNEVDVRGKLQVNYYGPHGGMFTFENHATFHANADGIFAITCQLVDTSDALYKVSTNASAVLQPGTQNDLNGDFEVLAGELRCLGFLNTFGRLVQKGGLIFVDRSLVVIFSDTP